jgi:plasmid stabilization system protein ParE
MTIMSEYGVDCWRERDLDAGFRYPTECRYPGSTQETSDPQIRVKIVGRYGYKIFYGLAADAIEILPVRHGARRPWLPERGR